ncbi:hypothetical protein PAXRUDRAFT_20579 [Paxillus rubicundulus Ve08.2h10]|uniref:Uncharacterized protein n=1 Tax=Paxillus rubicundulus Ve08.2h10 TaxID=930991 RepID=A0A0D0CS52_9AGAM|nr:hypothetical protein PAXRUDRAFT_20579 [Paxillus rubicundulus Ve08.2h10]
MQQVLEKALLPASPENTVPWQLQGFLDTSEAPIFGIGKVTMSPGYFMQSHERLADPLVTSATRRALEVQE